MAWDEAELRSGIVEAFIDAQQPLVDVIHRVLGEHREETLERHREYYRNVRTAPAWRRKENAAQSAKRMAAYRERVKNRVCAHCGKPVTREALRPQGGGKIPKYCSRKHMRAAVWKRWWSKQKKKGVSSR